MAYTQKGVLEQSKLYFYPAGQSEALFRPLSAGHFFCTDQYIVERENFQSILVLLVVDGDISFVKGEKEYTACAGETALIDCYEPHCYYAKNKLEAYWVHIDGGNTREFFGELFDKCGYIIKSNDAITAQIKEIYSFVKSGEKLTDGEISVLIYRLMISLFTNEGEGEKQRGIDAAMSYIRKHYAEKLDVCELSRIANMSESYFAHQFKKKVGTSPYDYILRIRLSHAKEMLKNTSMSICDIAYHTGFASESNFISYFKTREGLSPLKFRNTVF